MPTNNAIPMTVVENAYAVAMPAVSEAVIQTVSPTVELEQIEGGVRMTVHDVRGDHTGILEDGADGCSPIAGVSKSGGVVTITDKNGTTTATVEDGEHGASAYIHIRWAANQPTQDSDMSTTPNDWMGVYAGASQTAPTAYTDYAWVKVKGENGSAANVYGTTIPMSDQDSTKVAEAIGNKLNANQGSANAGKIMRILPDGELTPGEIYGNTLEMSASDGTTVAAAIGGKLDANQGSGNTGKFMRVGSDGALQPAALNGSNIPMADDDSTTIKNAVDGKIDKNQGSSYAGYHMIVNSAGNVVPMDFLIAIMQGASASADGISGVVPKPVAGDQGKFLRGDATWANPAVMTGAGSQADGAAGLVPKPFAGFNNKFLKGSGTWSDVCLQGSLTAISAEGTISDIALPGLTADFKVVSWGLFADSAATTPISPTEAPADITITEKANAYDITVANFSSAFYIRPTFILPQNN